MLVCRQAACYTLQNTSTFEKLLKCVPHESLRPYNCVMDLQTATVRTYI